MSGLRKEKQVHRVFHGLVWVAFDLPSLWSELARRRVDATGFHARISEEKHRFGEEAVEIGMKWFFVNWYRLVRAAYREKGFLFSVWAFLTGWFICLFFWGKEMKE